MLRTALRPKWLALLGLVLAICVLFGWLGMWQLNVAQRKAQTELLEQVEAAPAAPIDEILPPQTSITGAQVGRKVTATGVYDGSGQTRIVGRRLDGRVGSWILTPLVVETSGARLAVVRGFVADGGPVPPAPQGTITVAGTVQPQEGPPDERVPQPDGQLQTVDLSALVNVWEGDIYNAFVFASSETPPATGAAAEVTPVPPPVVDTGGVNMRNFAYAIQWWIFAAFALYLWWRMVRDDHRLQQEAGASDDRPVGPDDAIDPATDTPGPTRSISSAGGITP